jgi:MICAL-like protein 1
MNIGNFYETENENEYCCETCPDEEKLSIKSVVDSVSNDDVSETDNNDESLNVLKQSLSDEQKSANLNIQSNDSIEEQNIFSSDVNNEDEDENDDEEFSNLYESIKNQNENGENDISNEIETIINTTDTVKNVSVISEFIFENENENENENELENVKSEVETVCEDDKVCENEEIKEVVKIEEDEVVKEDEILPAPTPSDADNHDITESTINDNNEIITNSEIDIKLCENDIEIDISQLHEEEENSIETSTQDDSKYEKIINNTNQEHEQSSTSAQEEAPIPMKSLNPFDEDDDEEEEEIIQEKNKSQTIKYNKTLNPFGDDSDDDETAQVNDSIKLHRHEQERSLSRNSR